MLPKEIIIRIFSHLGTLEDLFTCAQVCSFWEQAINQEPLLLWQEIACRKYGSDVAQGTIALYDQQNDGGGSSWKAMLQDDNRKGALPILTVHKPCLYKYNGMDSYYCCWVECIKWHRGSRRVRIYLDVRGESDLRDPSGSSLRFQTGPAGHYTFRGAWHSELEEERLGHYKGYLDFPYRNFDGTGTYFFCYANFHHGIADYESIPIMKIPWDGTLLDIFCSTNGHFPRYALELSPFAADTPESERSRWEEIVDPQVFTRRHHPRWWV
jgi:hypothetical protein